MLDLFGGTPILKHLRHSQLGNSTLTSRPTPVDVPGSAPPHPQRAWKMFFPFSTALGYASSLEGMYMYVHKFYTSMQVHIYIYSVYIIYTRKDLSLSLYIYTVYINECFLL